MPNVLSISSVRIGALAAAFIAALALALAAGAAPAHAALVATGACDDASLSKPFAAWGDAHDYKLLPGGDFEGALQGWALGGATVVPGGAQGSARALELTPGDSVQTPTTCVNTSYPTFRMFARNITGAGTVLVSVVYRVPLLGAVAVPVGTVALQNGAWSPSLTMLTASTVTGVLSNGTAQVAIRFTSLLGSVAIDRVYVDPRMR